MGDRKASLLLLNNDIIIDKEKSEPGPSNPIKLEYPSPEPIVMIKVETLSHTDVAEYDPIPVELKVESSNPSPASRRPIKASRLKKATVPFLKVKHLEGCGSYYPPYICNCQQKKGLQQELDDEVYIPFQCNFCKFQGRTVFRLRKHMGKRHPGETHAFKCKSCLFESPNVPALRKHILEKHIGKRYICNQCDFKCLKKRLLAMHVIRRHSNDKPYACNLCSYTAKMRRNLNEHIKSVHVNGNYEMVSCYLCSYKCCTERVLTKHIKAEHMGEKRVYSCLHCEYVADSKCRLQQHIRTHTGEKPYSCNLCEYKCSGSSALNAHKNRHTNKKAYSCHLCGYTAKVQIDVNKHLKDQHSKNYSMFKCTVCPYQAKSAAEVNMHFVNSTGDKRYQCSVCSHTYQRKYNLKMHLKLHPEVNYSCPLCTYMSPFEDEYNQHFEEHGK